MHYIQRTGGKRLTLQWRTIRIVIFVGCTLTPCWAAGAPLRFATVDFAPYALVNGTPEKPGLIVEINAAIAARAKVKISDTILPIARVMKNLRHGLSDCAVFLLSPWSKERFIAVGEVIGRFDSIVVSRKGISINHVDDLQGRLLALPIGSYVGFQIGDDPKIRHHRTNGCAQSAKLLQAGRVDAIAGTALSICHYLSDLKMNRADIGDVLLFDRKPIWLHCREQSVSKAVIERFRQATNSLRTEGVFDRMFERYIPVGFR